MNSFQEQIDKLKRQIKCLQCNQSGSENIYNIDGLLLENRTLYGGENDLNIIETGETNIQANEYLQLIGGGIENGDDAGYIKLSQGMVDLWPGWGSTMSWIGMSEQKIELWSERDGAVGAGYLTILNGVVTLISSTNGYSEFVLSDNQVFLTTGVGAGASDPAHPSLINLEPGNIAIFNGYHSIQNNGDEDRLETDYPTVFFDGSNVGINASTPTAKLHVNGTMRFVTGNEGAGKVMGSDVDGNADWQLIVDAANDFVNDAAAAIGGIDVGSLYHTSGVVKIRLS